MHFIGKQELLFDFQSERTANAWVKGSNAFYRDEILPVLTEVFDDVASDKWYALDRLEIDLGELDTSDIREVLSEAVKKALNKLLPLDASTFPLAEGSLLAEKAFHQYSTAGEDVTVKSYPEVLMGLFFEFLDHGTVRWHTAFKGIDELETALLKEVGIERMQRDMDLKARMNFASKRMRLIYQFSRSFSALLLRAFFSEELQLVKDFQQLIFQRLVSLFVDSASISLVRDAASVDPIGWLATIQAKSGKNLQRALLHRLINRIASVAATSNDPSLSSEVFKLLTIDNHFWPSFPDVVEIMQSSAFTRQRTNKLLKVAGPQKGDGRSLSNRPNPFSSIPSSGNSNNNQTDLPALPADAEASFIRKETPKALSDTSDPGAPTSGTEAEREYKGEGAGKTSLLLEAFSAPFIVDGIGGNAQRGKRMFLDLHAGVPELTEYYVQHAGLVLCWPYLQRLFARCRYLYTSDFKNETAQERAIHLLGYIATGREKCPEFLLTLQKFLIGWPLEMPVRRHVKLFRKEKKEADTMLRGLITNWPILKNTSVDGLRSSFLQREGKLAKHENIWRLTVEQKSYDMVLDYLPYTLSIIKLPWNKNVLKVDWA